MRWSKKTIKLLSVNGQVLLADILKGETVVIPFTLTQSTSRTVSSVSGMTLTFAGGDNTAFYVGQKIKAYGDTVFYTVQSFTTNTVTVDLPLDPMVFTSGKAIYGTFDVTSGITWGLNLLERTATIVYDSKGNPDLENIQAVQGKSVIPLSSSVSTVSALTSTGIIQLPGNTFPDSSAIDNTTDQCIVYTGALSWTLPGTASGGVTYIATTREMAVAIVLSNNGYSDI